MPKYTTDWSTRSSQLGYHMQCDLRALLDRQIALNEIEAPAGYDGRRVSSPYADFGTCTHWFMQAQLRCIFPDADDEVNKVHIPATDTLRDIRIARHKYTDERFKSACKMFDDNEDRTTRMMAKVATLAISVMPTPEDGKPWLAESHWRNQDCSGHIDFLSQDKLDVVDLKTTTMKPPKGRMKPEHLVQQVGYAFMVYHRTGIMPKRIYVLYVSSRGEWVTLSEPFVPEDNVEFVRQVWAYARYLRSSDLYDRACPHLGDHCFKGFCPYVDSCRDKIIPAAAHIREAAATPAPTPHSMEELFSV